MRTITIVDDDVSIGNLLEETLTRAGYAVLRAYSGTEALLLTREKRPDLILLDRMLPGKSGEEILSAFEGIPVIFLSAKADPAEKAELLLRGAADYITKPFDTKELLARITVQLRRAAAEGVGTLTFGPLTLYTDRREACTGGKTVKLTRTECAILRLLLQNPHQVLTKAVLLDRLSLDTPDCVESSLKVHVSNLRRKLREADGRDYIESVWGIGFKMRTEIFTES